jgi:hypothetical protein
MPLAFEISTIRSFLFVALTLGIFSSLERGFGKFLRDRHKSLWFRQSCRKKKKDWIYRDVCIYSVVIRHFSLHLSTKKLIMTRAVGRRSST